MKKLFFLLILTLLTFALLACTEADTTTAPDTTPSGTTAPDTSAPDTFTPDAEDPFDGKTNKAILEELTAEVENLTLVYEDLRLSDKDGFKFHFFVDLPSSVKSGALAQPMIGTTPFFVGILKVETAKDAEELAKNILDNVNYQKLVCVSFKKAYTRAVGTTVVLIMDINVERADALLERFNSMAA